MGTSKNEIAKTVKGINFEKRSCISSTLRVMNRNVKQDATERTLRRRGCGTN